MMAFFAFGVLLTTLVGFVGLIIVQIPICVVAWSKLLICLSKMLYVICNLSILLVYNCSAIILIYGNVDKLKVKMNITNLYVNLILAYGLLCPLCAVLHIVSDVCTPIITVVLFLVPNSKFAFVLLPCSYHGSVCPLS